MGAMNKMLKWIGLADDVDADETVESSMAQAEEELLFLPANGARLLTSILLHK